MGHYVNSHPRAPSARILLPAHGTEIGRKISSEVPRVLQPDAQRFVMVVLIGAVLLLALESLRWRAKYREVVARLQRPSPARIVEAKNEMAARSRRIATLVSSAVAELCQPKAFTILLFGPGGKAPLSAGPQSRAGLVSQKRDALTWIFTPATSANANRLKHTPAASFSASAARCSSPTPPSALSSVRSYTGRLKEHSSDLSVRR